MAWPTAALFDQQLHAFPPLPTPEQALANAEVNYKHETDALVRLTQHMRLCNVAFGHSPDFERYPGHRCSIATCTMVRAPERELVYECPFPHEHPPHKRNIDGSVLHRWSGNVSVCYGYGTPHICTPNMCSHQTSSGGELVCTLTGLSLGPEVCNVSELDYAFESGKAMTSVHLDSSDRDAIDARVGSYVAERPENVSLRASVAGALEDARALEARGTKRRIELAAQPRIGDGARTAGRLGLLEAAPAPPVLSITERLTRGPRPLPRALIVQAPAGAQPSLHPFSAIGSGPTELDIRAFFERTVNNLWDLLEEAYDLRRREEELRVAERRVIHRCIDRRRGSGRDGAAAAASSSASPLQFGDIAAIHGQETRTAFEGMIFVRILANCPDWTSRRIRRVCTTQLSERLWKLWVAITRSPKYHREPGPHLYERVVGAMLKMVIEGYDMTVCVVPSGERSTYYIQSCAQQKDATSVDKCGHREMLLPLVDKHHIVRALLEPEGIRRRALDRVCGYVLGNWNTVAGFLNSILEEGRRGADIRAIRVCDSDPT